MARCGLTQSWMLVLPLVLGLHLFIELCTYIYNTFLVSVLFHVDLSNVVLSALVPLLVSSVSTQKYLDWK